MGARLVLKRYVLCPAHRVLLIGLILPASQAAAQSITSADYTIPTTRYAHGILGDAIEHGALALKLSNGRVISVTLPISDVFEDTSPRLSDMDGDGNPEVIVVAYIDRLHLAKTLRIWRFVAGELIHVADLGGLHQPPYW